MADYSMVGVSDIGKIPSGPYVPHKEIFSYTSPRSPLSAHSHDSESLDMAMDAGVDTSIDQLYNNVCEMQSSDHSPSRYSYLSYGQESRIDSELRFLAGGDFRRVEPTKAAAAAAGERPASNGSSPEKQNGTSKKDKVGTKKKIFHSSSAKCFPTYKSSKPNQGSKSFHDNRPPIGKRTGKASNKPNGASPAKNEKNSPLGTDDGAYLGPYLLKQTRELVSSGENPKKALELAVRAMRSFETACDEKPNLEYVMCLHIVAALYCSLGQYRDAIPVLERSIEVPAMDEGQSHSLAKFAGCMQLGDTYAMLGQIENSILCYTAGLEIQRQVLGEKDSRFGETCRYVAEAHVQAMQFDEAEKLCQMALNIHKENASPGSLEEAADRRLMGLICDAKGDYEAALEHYVLAGMTMAANGQESDVAIIDCNIGDAYLSLARYDEAIFAYQKALNAFKATKGDNHSSVGSVFVRLADLYNKIGKFRESKSYCENALRIYLKPSPGSTQEEVASGLIEVSGIYESMNETEQALKLLNKALKAYGNAPGQQSMIAGIEAQMGIMYNMVGSYTESYETFKNAVTKFRAAGEKRNGLFGITLNQMGLSCVQINEINEAAQLFEEARSVLEMEYGPYHPDTLGVYSNLAGTYDAMGRWEDAIEILETVVAMREDKLGTANPDVDDEKRRLGELLKESGRDRRKKSSSLEFLLGSGY